MPPKGGAQLSAADADAGSAYVWALGAMSRAKATGPENSKITANNLASPVHTAP
jgi:hypothetical protein